MQFLLIRNATSLLLILLLANCQPKNQLPPILHVKQAQIPIYIDMPKNPLAFDNISPIIYQGLHNEFLRIGYKLVNRTSDGYVFRSKIKNLDPISKFISPDIILLHYTIRLELECTLLNFNQHIIAQKTFLFSTLISKPRNPIINSDFLDFAYKRLMQRSTPKIERYFRPYLIDAFNEL